MLRALKPSLEHDQLQAGYAIAMTIWGPGITNVTDTNPAFPLFLFHI